MALKLVKSHPPTRPNTPYDDALWQDWLALSAGRQHLTEAEIASTIERARDCGPLSDWPTFTNHKPLEQTNSVHLVHRWPWSGEGARGALRTNAPRASSRSWWPPAPRVVAAGVSVLLLAIWIAVMVLAFDGP